MLFELVEGLVGFLLFFAIGVELKIGLKLGDGFVLLLELLRDLGEGEVSVRVVGLDFDGVFGAEIGALKVAVSHIEPGDGEVFVDTLIVGLHLFRLWQLAVR